MVKRDIGKIGEPKFKRDDLVTFEITLNASEGSRTIQCIGTVAIIDAYGTFEQNEEPSYDILVNNFDGRGEMYLVKHIRESGVSAYEKPQEGDEV